MNPFADPRLPQDHAYILARSCVLAHTPDEWLAIMRWVADRAIPYHVSCATTCPNIGTFRTPRLPPARIGAALDGCVFVDWAGAEDPRPAIMGRFAELQDLAHAALDSWEGADW